MARILFLSERFPPDIGGLAASSARISSSLAKLGHEVVVLAWSRHVAAGQLMEQPLSGELEHVHGLPGERLKVYRQGQYRNWDLTMTATMNAMEWLHQNWSFDIVWGHYLSAAGFLAVWFAQLKNLRSTVSARGNDVDTEIFPPGDLARLLWTVERADLITAVSRDMARKIEILSKRSDIQVLTNVVDSNHFVPKSKDADQRAALGIQPGEFVLGFAGELREKKGMQFLLDAFREVRSQIPACLLLIGEVRSQQRPVLQIFNAEYPEHASRLIITGHLQSRDLVVDHINACDLFLLPSLLEGMPNSLLEAMACERLCIASDAGGIPELIIHGQNGFLLSRAHLNHLGTAIIEANELDSDTKSTICAAARKTVIESFSMDKELERLAEIVEQLVQVPR